MERFLPNRRAVLTTASAGLLMGAMGPLAPARAQTLAPTPTMRGGANNYEGYIEQDTNHT